VDAATFILALTWLSLTAYAVFAGADFGAGTWDLLAGSADRGRPRRRLIEHVIGPVWEANHVWLIFVLVLLWTAFPPVFAAIASTLWIPMTLAALGIIGRGSAFAFRKTVTEVWQQRLFGATFAVSSVATPFFLGTIAGAIASGRVPPGLAKGDTVGSWTSPVAVLAGLLAVAACSFLAATYLCRDAARDGDDALADWFRLRALGSGVVAGALALATLVVTHADAARLFDGLTGRAFPLVLLSVLAGIAALALVAVRRFTSARIAAALAVTGLVWGWGVAQYPHLLPGLDAHAAAAVPTTLDAVVVTSLIGLALLAPSMYLLLRLFQQPMPSSRARAARSGDQPLGSSEGQE
jgi:cytochrome bd ubiquinol oxidase subunit II